MIQTQLICRPYARACCRCSRSTEECACIPDGDHEHARCSECSARLITIDIDTGLAVDLKNPGGGDGNQCPGCNDTAIHLIPSGELRVPTWVAEDWKSGDYDHDQAIDFCPFCGVFLPLPDASDPESPETTEPK